MNQNLIGPMLVVGIVSAFVPSVGSGSRVAADWSAPAAAKGADHPGGRAAAQETMSAGPPTTAAEAWEVVDDLLAEWQSLRRAHGGVSLTQVASRARKGESPTPAVRAIIDDARAAGFFARLSEVGGFALLAEAGSEMGAADPLGLRHLVLALAARAWVAIADGDLWDAEAATRDLVGLTTLMYLQADDITILMAGTSEEMGHAAALTIFARAADPEVFEPLRAALSACDARAQPGALVARLATTRARHIYGVAAAEALPGHARAAIEALAGLAPVTPRLRSGSAAEAGFRQELDALFASEDLADRTFGSELRNVHRALSVLERSACVRGGLIVLGGLRARALATGAYPASLSDLVPGELEALPEDVYGGGPFRYSRAADARAMALWGVGFDGVDHGGACPRGPMTGLRANDAGQDCVFWPAP